MDLETTSRTFSLSKPARRVALGSAALFFFIFLTWMGMTTAWNPHPMFDRQGSLAGILNIAVLVSREGLECVLVLSAVTASMMKSGESYQRPVAAGVAVGMLATLATWFVAAGIVDDLTSSINALYVQAGTGLLAIIVLLVVMNWFFHKLYWTGWISLHNKRKRDLMESAEDGTASHSRIFLGMALLGFTSFYREGVEVVLFLQSYRLKLGGEPVFYGVLLGLLLTGIVAILTFLAHRKLPYKKMLILTGAMLGAVLLVMVGEQAQEMQLAHWLPTTVIPSLEHRIPEWMGLWFSLFPTVQTLSAQALAAVVVLGSYIAARK
ncbi:MAG TPA: FTR1 family protein [Acidobacteriaceae bacterium]|nr:FTR1 family protein [Acidobacteriaceae bacterium]